MKKFLSALLAASMMFGVSTISMAAPIYENGDTLKNTVGGFNDGAKSLRQDVTQSGGNVEVPFDLGENGAYYEVDIRVSEGSRYIDAEYNKSKKSIILIPDVPPTLSEEQNFELDIDILDSETGKTVAENFSLFGQVYYDEIQTVENNGRYKNSRGVLYDFSDGRSNVEISVGNSVRLSMPKKVRGLYNLHLTDTRNASIDYMFSKHELQFLHFPAKPKFNREIQVTVAAEEGWYLYSYADGKLQRVRNYIEGQGYVLNTRQLDTLILSNAQMNEGIVDESKNLVRPFSA